MKKLLIAALLALATGCTSHHSFMDKAYVGIVDNAKVVVMFEDSTRNGIKYYRPQFASECPYNKVYAATDSNSTTCLIRENRITHLESYNEHIKSGTNLTPVKDQSIIHETMENVQSTVSIPDNL